MIQSALDDVKFYFFIIIAILIMGSFIGAIKKMDLNDTTKEMIDKQEKSFYQSIWFIVTVWGIIGSIVFIVFLYNKFSGGSIL